MAAPLGVWRRTTWPWWLAATTWFVVTSLAHLEFSLWLVRPREGAFGSFRYADFVPVPVVAGLLGLVVCLYRQLRACKQPVRLALWWLVWFACVVAFDRYLTFSSNEIAHYPQYAFLAWLIAHALDPDKVRWVPGRILFWTTLFGMVDEFQQYVWIAPSYGMHLDFNDFLVNLIAAAAGAMLYYGASLDAHVRWRVSEGTGRPFVEIIVAGVLAVAILMLLVTDRIATMPSAEVPPGGLMYSEERDWRLYLEREAGILGSLSAGQRHGHYFILDPFRALTLMGLFAALFGRYPLWPWEWPRRRYSRCSAGQSELK